jgi:hypothetical protein
MDGKRGAALFDFTSNRRFALIHGNEFLEVIDPNYPKHQRYRAVEHTLAAVMNILEQPLVHLPEVLKPLPDGVTDALGVFVGYLILDAWIGNTDRHHENWGLLLHKPGRRRLTLAPSYDHASSLGRELSDEARTRRGNPAHGTPVERYARKAKSAFFPGDGGTKALSTFEAVRVAAARRPEAGNAWRNRLREVSHERVRGIVDAIPDEHMSGIAKDFACALLAENAKLLGV